jgi:hypothetical protein
MPRESALISADGAFLEGCPWDAIAMVALAEWEGEHGTLPF